MKWVWKCRCEVNDGEYVIPAHTCKHVSCFVVYKWRLKCDMHLSSCVVGYTFQFMFCCFINEDWSVMFNVFMCLQPLREKINYTN